MCKKCNKDFEEKNIQESHDIPKYLGGTDKDGRHWLCKPCHELYELTILIRCLKHIGEYVEDDLDWLDKSEWMKELKKQPEELKEKLREIANKVKEEWYGRN